jgi:UDP:flavonoid glycosyltransferase YjiC (YdhE family)
MAALAKCLQARGRDVLLAAAPDFEALSRHHGIEFKPVGSPIRLLAQAMSGQVNGRTFSGMRVMLDWCRLGIREQFEQLVPLLEGADRIVAGGLQFAAGSFAERHGIDVDIGLNVL